MSDASSHPCVAEGLSGKFLHERLDGCKRRMRMRKVTQRVADGGACSAQPLAIYAKLLLDAERLPKRDERRLW